MKLISNKSVNRTKIYQLTYFTHAKRFHFCLMALHFYLDGLIFKLKYPRLPTGDILIIRGKMKLLHCGFHYRAVIIFPIRAISYHGNPDIVNTFG